MDYIEYNFTLNPVQPYGEILVAQLAPLGFDMFEDTPTGMKAYVAVDQYNDAITQEIKNILSDIAGEVAVQKQLIKAENWNALWESNFEPVWVGNDCYIRATFHPARPDTRYEIVIDPKMSFGTGHHQTTASVIQHMLMLDFTDKTVLDMGCGTAVLAILAAKMGAKAITAIDIDEWAYTNSLENITRNHTPHIRVLQGGAEVLDNTYYDVILANINKNIILRDIALYNAVLNKGGTLILSGFLDVDVNDITTAVSKLGLQKQHVQTDQNWAAIRFVK